MGKEGLLAWAYRLPKILLGSAMPDPSAPCRRETPETAFWPFQRWPTRWAGNFWLFSTPLDTLRRTHMAKSDDGDQNHDPPSPMGFEGGSAVLVLQSAAKGTM
jgi:hypothetical protein